MTALAILWFFLVFLLIAGYFILDGFDLGIGILYPFICKNGKEQRMARRAIGPIWDGNEVWLLTAGGALFAAFPDAYATTFSGFYLAIMLVLFGLIVRAVSFEFWSADSKWRPVWNICFFLGSLIPALLFGVAIGNVIAGIPLDLNGDYMGIPLLGLISPFTLMCGLLGLAMFIAAGACWLSLKAPLGSALRSRARAIRLFAQVASLVLFAATSGVYFMFIGEPMEIFVPMIGPKNAFAALVVICLIAGVVFGLFKSGAGDTWAFLLQSASAGCLVFMVACSLFPTLVTASPDGEGTSISLMTAGASDLSLTYMTVILCIGLPLVLIYHVIIYRTFRGRVNQADLSEE